ncbi:tryptophan aminotransferase-related protein 3-like [Tripterygium wilfordii]|uniref:Tryptophan aminotransferase-related protein 3-like n=1 Tax=Tripterygium wilfordii TaxID=458696 RepID=A0A7J7DSH2_TRIWF|nr:tryptophan aminotransferase-related protein 3-like [Tripterygium wilfordii]
MLEGTVNYERQKNSMLCDKNRLDVPSTAIIVKTKGKRRNLKRRAKMAKNLSSKYMLCLVTSIILNILLIIYLYVGGGNWHLTWTKGAGNEAEAVAAVYCSGHGRAYLDGFVLDGNLPVCECNSCYGGPDCSHFNTSYIADADGYSLSLWVFLTNTTHACVHMV